jgi:hypothetical protein
MHVPPLKEQFREIDGYIDQLERAEDDGRRARVLNWALNYLAANLISNLRFDRIADQQAELARLAEGAGATPGPNHQG